MAKVAWLKSLLKFKRPDEGDRSQYWFSRFSSPIIFLIVVLTAVGAYFAFTLPVAVFPETNFPRVVVGIDNGVMPIDQMLVTITRPIEEAVNSVPGLQQVRSITSRGQAEVDLFLFMECRYGANLATGGCGISNRPGNLAPQRKN